MDTLDETQVAHLERVPASSLRFGDRLPYFSVNVRSVTDRGDGMVRVQFVKRLGQTRDMLTMYADDMVHVIRAGSLREVA